MIKPKYLGLGLVYKTFCKFYFHSLTFALTC